MRPGARRFDTQSSAAVLYHVAAENPDGERVLVVTNPGDARTVRLKLGKLGADVPLSKDSITTLWWR
jgi:hypothetical protein